MKRVHDFLKEAKTYYLATTEGDQPRVRPFGTIAIFEGKLYIQTGKIKNVSRQMQENPKVELCAMLGNEWIRVAAEVVRDDRLEPKLHMLEVFPELKAMYNPTDDITETLYLKNATATIYGFGTEPVEIKFG